MAECRPMRETPLASLLIREHRRLDELFGRFLAAAHGDHASGALEAIVGFDESLRRHTAFEERYVLPEPEGRKLLPTEEESDGTRVSRELRLEHVQVRELSAMIRRILEESQDVGGARRLAPNLARRWDRHTTREEKELPRLEEEMGESVAAALREAGSA